MAKTNLLGNIIRLNGLLRNGKPNQALPSLFMRESLRYFSNGTEEQQKDLSVDPFLQPPNTGLVYGKLIGVERNTLKTDIVNLLDGSNLKLQDIKVEYNWFYAPAAMILQFSSRSSFEAAFRSINRKGRLYKLDKIDRGAWDILKSYDGIVLLQGIPHNALPDDIERFLSGCDYNASSIKTLVRPAFPDPIRMALVQFPSQTEAMNAVLVKNRSFCLNNQISMRVLQ